MKLNRKWILVASLVLSLAVVTSGTLAYLQDSESAENVFTVGNVDIKLTEDKFVEGKMLLPGVTIEKNPYISNEGNTAAWVWMDVIIPTDLFGKLDIDWNETDWVKSEPKSGEDGNTVVTMKRENALGKGETTKPAFTRVKVPANVTELPQNATTEESKVNIIVKAYAVQTEGIADIDTARYASTGKIIPEANVSTFTEERKLINEKYDEPITIVGEGRTIKAHNRGNVSGEIALDVAYQFEPAMSFEECKESEYAYWLADFVVSANEDIPKYGIGLAGYYDAWCHMLADDQWIMLATEDIIFAGTEIRLIQQMGEGGIFVHYKDICEFGNDGIGFLCGAAALAEKNIAGINAEALKPGTELTVELRLYETKSDDKYAETGNYITIGKYTHTFE